MKLFQETNKGICFNIKVVPKSSKTEMIGWEGNELKIRLAAVPEKGKANGELIRYLAKVLGIGQSKVHLIGGETSRHKRICIEGLNLEEIQAGMSCHLN